MVPPGIVVEDAADVVVVDVECVGTVGGVVLSGVEPGSTAGVKIPDETYII